MENERGNIKSGDKAMTDADWLRERANTMERISEGASEITKPEIMEFICTIRRIASLLDAVPPEVLRALADKTWKAVPVEPTDEMRYAGGLGRAAAAKISSSFGQSVENSLNYEDRYQLTIYRVMLAAAPTKPEE